MNFHHLLFLFLYFFNSFKHNEAQDYNFQACNHIIVLDLFETLFNLFWLLFLYFRKCMLNTLDIMAIVDMNVLPYNFFLHQYIIKKLNQVVHQINLDIHHLLFFIFYKFHTSLKTLFCKISRTFQLLCLHQKHSKLSNNLHFLHMIN